MLLNCIHKYLFNNNLWAYDLSVLFTWDGLVYLVILSLLEIVLGIDNIIFISILTNKLPEEIRKKARTLGIALALIEPGYELGSEVAIDVRGRTCAAKITALPFLPSHVR